MASYPHREKKLRVRASNVDCTVIITHYQTPDLLETAVSSFRAHYPAVPVVVVDNGSSPASDAALSQVQNRYPGVSVHRFGTNRYQGPAMDYAIRELASTPYVFTLDSDTETRRAGFLEAMIDALEADESRYACGRVLLVDRQGYPASEDEATPICWVPYALFRRDAYLSLPPFEHHGVPNLANGREAHRRGLEAVDFPIADYIHHIGRGTADRYGYGLGARGLIRRLLSRF